MITANDLKNIDFFLGQRERIINQPKEHREMIGTLRDLIASELSKIKIRIEKGGKKQE